MADTNQDKTLSEVLKAAIVESELPLLTLEQETGVRRASIMRFLRGDSSLRLDIAERLAAYLDLELVSKHRKSRKGN